MGSLHSCHKQLIAQKPINTSYPTSLNTLGDHLRKVRLDRGMSQPQVAKLIKVTTDTVTGWELNRFEPQARLAKRIIKFLGYLPSNGKPESIGWTLRQARMVLGHTQKQAAKRMNCDESNIRQIESGKRYPRVETSRKIERYSFLAEEKLKVL